METLTIKIKINDQRKIFAIKEEFNAVFPYLKLEFYSKASNANSAHSTKFVKANSKTLNECRTIHNNGEITVSPNMTVAELYQRFMDIYGIGVQLFRKSGKAWLQTTFTDGWTLEEQNHQGKILSET